MTDRSAVHATFTVDRTYPVAPQRVWAAFADQAQKAKWFGGANEGYTTIASDFDFTVGGREHNEGKWDNGTVSQFDAIYLDIVENERIIYTYYMFIDGKKISVSIATLEFTAADGGTHLKLTEQGAYLDGLDNSKQREEGTNWLMDELGKSLA